MSSFPNHIILIFVYSTCFDYNRPIIWKHSQSSSSIKLWYFIAFPHLNNIYKEKIKVAWIELPPSDRCPSTPSNHRRDLGYSFLAFTSHSQTQNQAIAQLSSHTIRIIYKHISLPFISTNSLPYLSNAFRPLASNKELSPTLTPWWTSSYTVHQSHILNAGA